PIRILTWSAAPGLASRPRRSFGGIPVNASLASQTETPRQPEPARAVARFLKRGPRLLIGGEWLESKSRDSIGVIDPATGREIALVADANADDVNRAVAAAREAFETGPWS